MALASSRVSLAVRAYESFNSRVQSLGVRVVPRRAWTEEADDGGFLSRTMPRVVHATPPSVHRQSHAIDSSNTSNSNTIERSPPMISAGRMKNASPQNDFPPSTLVVDLSKPPALFSFADDSSSERGSERAGSEPPPSNRPSSIYLDHQQPLPSYTNCPADNSSSSGAASLYPRYTVVGGSSPSNKATSPDNSSIKSSTRDNKSSSSMDQQSSLSRSVDNRSTLSPQKSLSGSTTASLSSTAQSTAGGSDFPPSQIITSPSKVTKDITDLDSQGSANASGGLVIISMTAEGQGRFGFNVKGGADQGVPVIVSRVAGGTPADTCIPRLAEGDQVLYFQYGFETD